jgi:hypothetical protein
VNTLYSVLPLTTWFLACVDNDGGGDFHGSDACFREYMKNYDLIVAENNRRVDDHNIPSIF